jgi:hypothetical protein
MNENENVDVVVEQPVAVKAKKVAQPRVPKAPRGYEAILSAASLPLKLSGATHASVSNDVANNIEGLWFKRGNAKDWTKIGGKDSVPTHIWQKRAVEYVSLSHFMNPLSDSGSGYRRWVVKYSKELLEWAKDARIRVQLDSKKNVTGIEFGLEDAVNEALLYEKSYVSTLKAFAIRQPSVDKPPRKGRQVSGGKQPVNL